MESEILRLLRTRMQLMSAGALSMMTGRIATGVLGEGPASDVAEALVALQLAGAVVSLPACPTCGQPGVVWTVAGEGTAAGAPVTPLGAEDILDVMMPLIREGAIELGERVELVERTCCVRTARPWRPSPKPI